ncbi:MAG: glycosyltransferase [Ruminococcaceae bacterium]|nr:glycosyltransferase [Oscillospiraceae bacterium]
MLNVTIVIPTLNPSEKIFDVVSSCHDSGFERIIVINDGSRDDCAPIFDSLASDHGCEVLTHEVNRGKGRALKTAMQYFLGDPKGNIGIVTLDDDGQHTTADTVKVAEALIQEPDKLVLGVRDFSLKNVPPKSKWGNRITALFMKLLCGVSVSDTQTGLRAIPLSAIPAFIEVDGERFEYETCMLLETSRSNIGIKEVKIETVYIENNSGTHFHPLRDSFMIYKQLFAFAGSAIASFSIDNGLFWLFTHILPIPSKEILVPVCTYLARLFSSVFNFFTNKKLVFSSDDSTISTAIRYYTLCIVQTGISALLTIVLSDILSISEGILLTMCKFISDCILAFFSYRIQRGWVFSKSKKQ